MASLLSFILGLLVGVAFVPVLLPAIKKAWFAIVAAMNRPQ